MSAIPASVQTVIELFSTDLAAVRFGDVDTQSLVSAAAAVESAAVELASVEAMVAETRARLQEHQDALLQHAHRALAYARVYAEPDAGLSARLEAISLPRSTRRARAPEASPNVASEPQVERRPRGRPRRTAVAAEPLLEGVGE